MTTARTDSSEHYLENWETFDSLFNLKDNYFNFNHLLDDYNRLCAEQSNETDQNMRRRIELKMVIDKYIALKKLYLANRQQDSHEVPAVVMEDARVIYHILVANLDRDITILSKIKYQDENFSALNQAQINLVRQQGIFNQNKKRPGELILYFIDVQMMNDVDKAKEECVHPAHAHDEHIVEYQKSYNGKQLLQKSIDLIETYKKSLFRFNFYGRKRADELKAQLTQLAFLNCTDDKKKFTELRTCIAKFIYSGKTASDYSVWSFFRSPSRTSGVWSSSLRGMFIDYFAPHTSANKEEWLRATYIHSEFKSLEQTIATVQKHMLFSDSKKSHESPTPPNPNPPPIASFEKGG